MFEKKSPVETDGPAPPEVPLKAFRVGIEVKFDLEGAEVSITSWSMDGFRLSGRDLFDLMERVPAEIEAWFHRRDGVEVVVIPVYSAFDAHSRRLEDGYVALPVRPLVAAVRDMEPRR